MPRRTTEFAPGQYYHIYNRGVGRQLIFLEEENYLYLLRQDDEESAGLLPQLTFNSYTKAFNKRYGRIGTLFEGRYRSVWVDKTKYLFHLCRYIHANPVKARLVSRLADWPFSNYLEWMEMRNGTLVDYDFIAQNFPERDGYRQFVMEYLGAFDVLPEGIEPYLLD